MGGANDGSFTFEFKVQNLSGPNITKLEVYNGRDGSFPLLLNQTMNVANNASSNVYKVSGFTQIPNSDKSLRTFLIVMTLERGLVLASPASRGNNAKILITYDGGLSLGSF